MAVSIQGVLKMADVAAIVTRLKDAETDSKLASVPLYVPQGDTIAHYQAMFDEYAELLDNVTGSQIMEASITIPLVLPGGLKATPVAASFNERGGLVQWDTDGQWSDSFRIPAILTSIMSGDTFLLTGAIGSLNSFLIAGDGIVIPKTRDGFEWVQALAGVKSFRRK